MLLRSVPIEFVEQSLVQDDQRADNRTTTGGDHGNQIRKNWSVRI